MKNVKSNLSLLSILSILVFVLIFKAGFSKSSVTHINLSAPDNNSDSNTMHFPSGGHSCICTVSYIPYEPLLLNPPDGEEDHWSWLSFPRLNRDGNSIVTVNEVLYGHIVPDGYTEESVLINIELGEEYEISSLYNLLNWNTGDLDNIKSTYGYKINLDYENEPENNWIILEGNVLDEDYVIPELSGFIENWVGYWSYQEQDIFDALEDHIDEIYHIKHQDYTCYRSDYPEGGQSPAIPKWICSHKTHNIKHGDMVILKPYNNVYNFSWTYPGNPPSALFNETTEYYSYSETDDYETIIVELDSTENPVELAVMIEDTCVGACTVSTDDTVKVIQAYIGDYSQDSLSFEMYFGTKSGSSSNSAKINKYFVKNRINGKYEKRSISTDEKKGAYFVSFKNNETENNIDKDNHCQIRIFPTPASTALYINYTIDEVSKVQIIAYDIMGRKVEEISNKTQLKGSYTDSWDFADHNTVKSGLYTIKITINDMLTTKKVVLEKRD